MEPWELALRIVLLGLSLILLFVGVQAYRRTGGRRMMWVLLAYLGFAALAVAAIMGEVYGDHNWTVPNNLVLILLLIIGANYLALLKD